jgi:hypothetical protein
MDVLDGPDGAAPNDLDVLNRVRTPGALELLSAFERLTPETRSSLLGLIRTLAAEASSAQLKMSA